MTSAPSISMLLKRTRCLREKRASAAFTRGSWGTSLAPYILRFIEGRWAGFTREIEIEIEIDRVKERERRRVCVKSRSGRERDLSRRLDHNQSVLGKACVAQFNQSPLNGLIDGYYKTCYPFLSIVSYT